MRECPLPRAVSTCIGLSLYLLATPSTEAQQEPPAAEAEDPQADPQSTPHEHTPPAEEAPEEDGFETVVVGSRHRRPLTEESRTVTLVGAEEIAERPGRTLADALDEVPGVHAQTTNRGAGSPIIRGQVGPSNLIVFDGVRFNNGTFRTGPNQYLNLFDIYSLARIEVLRGSGGVLYGSDAIGGTIHLLPRPLQYGRPWWGRGLARFQSADLGVTGAAEVGLGTGSLAALAGMSVNFFGDLTTGDGVELRGTDYQHHSARARLGYLITPDTEISMNAFATFVTDTPRLGLLDRNNFRTIDNTNVLTYLRASHLGTGAMREASATLSVNFTRELVTQNDCEVGDIHGYVDDGGEPILTTNDPNGCQDGAFSAVRRVGQNDDDAITVGGSISAVSDLTEGLSLDWGLDAYSTLVESSRVDFDKPDEVDPARPEARVEHEQERGNYSDDSTYREFGAYALLEYGWELGPSWTFRPRAGARVSHFRAEAEDVPDLGLVDYHFTGVAGQAQLALVQPGRAIVYGGWSQGVRAPNLQETTVLADTGNFFEVPNADLEPERSNDFELGTRLRLSPVGLELVGFYTLISDVITRRPATFQGADTVDGTPVRQRFNADEATFYGVETGVDLDIAFGLSVRGNLAWIEGEVTVAGETEPARRVPPLRWLGALRYDAESLPLSAEVVVQGAAVQDRLGSGDLDDLRICESAEFPGVLLGELGEQCPGTPDWITLDLRAAYVLDDLVTFRLALSNLLDERYRLHGSGLDAPGFGASVAVEVEY